MKNTIVIIVGPTAVGKTEYAIAVAKAIGGEIVSADSMQIYRHLDIGSAKPTKDEMGSVRHWLVDEIDPAKPFSAAEYQKLAKQHISGIFKRGKVPVISGGTGLYVNSLIYDMDFTVQPAQDDLRITLEREAEAHGSVSLHEKLKMLDPDAAERIHPNNLKKIIRAIEIYHVSGKSAKSFELSFKPTTDYGIIIVGLTRDRAELYARINKRADILFDRGLVEEVRRLLAMGLAESAISMQGIGYKEVARYLSGQCSLQDAVDIVKQNSRNYAKRQMTWFKRYNDVKWFNLSEYSHEEDALREVLEWIEQKSDIITNQTNRTI